MIKIILIETLKQIDELLSVISPKEYQQNCKVLSNSSIGMHVRHILEFVQCVIDGEQTGSICYDNRQRDELLQTNVDIAQNKIKSLIINIDSLNQEQMLQLTGLYGSPHEFPYNISTSIERELAYNIEHAIHHMAIIKIAIKQTFPHLKIPNSFGVAHSTIRFTKKVNNI